MSKNEEPEVRENLTDIIVPKIYEGKEEASKYLKIVEFEYTGTNDILHLQLEGDVSVEMVRIESLMKHKVSHGVMLYDTLYSKIRMSKEYVTLADLLFSNDIVFSFAMEFYPDLSICKYYTEHILGKRVFDEIQL